MTCILLLLLLLLFPLSFSWLLLLLLLLRLMLLVSSGTSTTSSYCSSLRQQMVHLLLLQLPLPRLAHLLELLLLLPDQPQCCFIGLAVCSRHYARDGQGRPPRPTLTSCLATC
jgi:hypothetical protein